MAYDPSQDISRNILFIAASITNSLANTFNRAFRQAGLDITVEQFSILGLLWYKEGLNQQEIAEFLNRDKTTITRVLDNMFKKNLLVKAVDQADRRNKRIYLTSKGKELQYSSVQIAGEIYMKALENLNEKDIEPTLKVLKTIEANLK